MRNGRGWAVALVVTAAVLVAPASQAAAAGPTAKFGVGMSPTARTGEFTPVTIFARDATDVPTPDYRGTVHFTSSDPAATLPPDHTFTAGDIGIFSFSVTFHTAGSRTITATDTVDGSITGASRNVAVSLPTASSLVVGTVPSGTTVGYPMEIVVTARGSGGLTDVNYRGTVDFTSAGDPQAMLPAAYTFTATDNGSHIFCPPLPWSWPNAPCVPPTPTSPTPPNVTFTGGGSFTVTGDALTVTATDRAHPSITGTSNPVMVTSAAPTRFQVAGLTQADAGGLFVLTVSALNEHGAATRGYLGTVHLTSSDPAAVLPQDHTFVATDAGTYQNVLVTFNTVGSQTVTVTDTSNASIKGTSAPVDVAGDPETTTTTTPSTTTTTAPGSTTTTTRAAGATPTASGPSTVHPGEQIALTGSGFPSNQGLRLTMFSTPTALGTTMSDAAGSFRASVTIPGDAPLGAHTIAVDTPDGAHKAVFAFTVTIASSPLSAPSPLSSLASPLARTGSSPLGPILLGCVLLTAGALALCAAKIRGQRLPIEEQTGSIGGS